MSAKRSLSTLMLLICLVAPFALFAGTHAASLKVRIEGEQVFFVPETQEGHFRLEIFGPGGELVFDSGLRGGQPAGWNLRDLKDQPVPDAVYVVLISSFRADGKEEKRMEQLILPRKEPGNEPAAAIADSRGTAGKIVKFTAPDMLGDSAITEDNNKIVIGGSRATATLHVDGAQPSVSDGNGLDATTLLQTSGGKGGNTTANAKAGKGADISLLAGIGGDAPVGTSGDGGSITMQPGSSGSGAVSGQSGRLLLAPLGGNVSIGTVTGSQDVRLTVEGNVQISGAASALKFPDNTTQTTAGLTQVTHCPSLSGDGTAGSPLCVADQGISTAKLQDGAVTTAKIADGAVSNSKIAPGAVTGDKIAPGAITADKIAPAQVVRSLNGLKDDVVLAAGTNITITPGGNTLTISAAGGGGGGSTSVAHNATLIGDGTNGNPLGVSIPLSLSGSNAGALLSVANAGTGPAIAAGGLIDTSLHYSIGGNRVLSVTGTSNVFAGVNAGINNSGVNNAFFGSGAGQANTIGNLNSFYGSQAGLSNTSGNQNSFFGNSAGQFNTTGDQNSFFGNGAGAFNTTGSFNSFFGHLAGRQNTAGGLNTFVGHQAGRENTTGGSNSFFGATTGLSNTTGSNNSFLGHASGSANTTGNANTFVGASAGAANISGFQNSFFGSLAGFNNVSGDNNSFFGFHAGQFNTANGNSFFGANAGLANSTGNANSFFGYRAGLNNNASSNSFFGSEAGRDNTSGNDNSFFGRLAGNDNTSGDNNSFFGSLAGRDNTTAGNNAFFGTVAGRDNTSGSNNSFFGRGSGLTNTTGQNNTAVGRGAGSSNTTEDNNTFVGTFTAAAPGVSNGTAVGFRAMVEQDNTIVLGSVNGKNGAGSNVRVGIGTTQPNARLHVNGSVRVTGAGIYLTSPDPNNNAASGSLVLTSPTRGIFLRSSNGTCWFLGVNDGGDVFTVQYPSGSCDAP